MADLTALSLPQYHGARQLGPSSRCQGVPDLTRSVRSDAQQPQHSADHVRVDVDPPAQRIPIPARHTMGRGKLLQ
jgi:hypothetical protein